MDTSKILSGKELVARGVTKTNATLPESGQKDISSNGTWLENKQIQSALESRKHLLEVERIEKLGSLSIAIWRDDLRLAEVIKKTGNHWQYIGHNVGKHLYLRPEEALFLIEINSMYLKHNDVIVSLQKAYTLCLDEINIAQYKVYASLSRLGYRVFRHRDITHENNLKSITIFNNRELSKSSQTESAMESAKSNDEGPLELFINQDCLNSNKSVTNKCLNTDANCQGNGLYSNLPDSMCSSLTSVATTNSNNVSEPMNSVSSEASTNAENTNEQFIDENKVVVQIIEDHEGSEVDENQINASIEKTLKSSGIDPNNDDLKTSDEIMPITQNTARTAIVLEYTPINSRIESTSIVQITDVDLKANKATMQNTALDIGNNATKPNTETQDDRATMVKEKDRNNGGPNTVIVTRKNNTIMDTGESNNAEDKKKKHEVANIIENVNAATVIVSTKNNMNIAGNSNTDLNKDKHNKRNNNTDNDSPELNSRRPDIIYSVDVAGVIRVFDDSDNTMQIDNEAIAESSCEVETTSNQNREIDNLEMYLMSKMQKLQHRRNQLKPRQIPNEKDKLTLPDCFDRKVVTVNSPHVQYLPRNIFLMKTNYLLNLEEIKRLNVKNRKDSTTESSDGDYSNEPRRLPVAGPSVHRPNIQIQPRPRHVMINQPIYPTYPTYFSPPIWCPRPPMPIFDNYGRPRYPVIRPVIHPNFNMNYARPRIFNENNPRKRGNPRFKSYHLRVIRKLAEKFKVVYAPNHVQHLVRLVNTFNEQYDERYHLTEDFKLVDLNEVQEVIVLEDDGEPKSKKSRLNDDNETINKHLEKLKSLAAKLEVLEIKKLATSRHRRVLSNAIKTFNKNFNADIYLDSYFKIIDSKLITLDSSSDSDSVIAVENPKKGKKLRNPFSIMKHLGTLNEASTSGVPILQQLSLNAINDGFNPIQNSETTNCPTVENTGVGLLKYFQNAWLPSEDDFGRAEIKSREESYFFDMIEAEYLYAYFKYRTRYFENWLDLKLAFMGQSQERIRAKKESAFNSNSLVNDRIQPLVGSDCTDTVSVLKKLQIIPSTKAVSSNYSHNSIEVDFDVYYSNSPHFRKANRPKPNFRVLCIDVSDDVLCSQHIDELCTKYTKDNVPLMLGAVGVGSISYMQVNHTDIPVYIPDNFY